MQESLKELLKFLQIGARIDLKTIALTNILGVTGSDTGLNEITSNSQILVSLISLLDDKNVLITKDASLCLVNISANEEGAAALLHVDLGKDCPPLQKPPDNIVNQVLNHLFNPESSIADQCCMILSNLSRPSHLIEYVVDLIENNERTFEKLTDIFVKNQHHKNGAKLHYLGPVLSNLSQSHRVRMHILNKDNDIIQRLLPFTEYNESLVRRGGVVGTLKNCCFETDFHEWLLSEEVDILPHLLLPLAGNEEFDEEDIDKLPVDLQYLPQDKLREEDADIRFILLEALIQLVAKKTNREFIRNKNTYLILRELHNWEKDKMALLACENLVDILIRTEEEIGEDNLKDIQIPEDLSSKFKEMDKMILTDK